jgi:hypothetical protein
LMFKEKLVSSTKKSTDSSNTKLIWIIFNRTTWLNIKRIELISSNLLVRDEINLITSSSLPESKELKTKMNSRWPRKDSKSNVTTTTEKWKTWKINKIELNKRELNMTKILRKIGWVSLKNRKLFLRSLEEELSDLNRLFKRKLQEVKNLTKRRLKDNVINSLAKVLQFNLSQEKETLSTLECTNSLFKKISEFQSSGSENKCISSDQKPACARSNNKTWQSTLVVDTMSLRNLFLITIESLRELWSLIWLIQVNHLNLYVINFVKDRGLRMLFIHWIDKRLEELFHHLKEDFQCHQPSDNKEPELMANPQTDTITSMTKLDPQREDYLPMLRKAQTPEKQLQLASTESLILEPAEVHMDQQEDNSENIKNRKIN